ncbi:DNA polymerase III subunit beta [Candidatus Poribacteria bacterium]|nr:DNA polymerase III subunit beta [Candidatus Poribacteria bacterium]
MRVIFARNDLHRAMQSLHSIASTKNVLPILSNVLLDASDAGVRMTTTDTEVGLQLQGEGSVEETGKLTIPARKLAELVRELPDEDVRLEASESGQIQIECGTVHYKMIGTPADDFPSIPELGDSFFTVDAGVLRQMIQRTRFAASREENRYFLKGVYMHLSTEWLRMVATDSRRLALMTFAAEGLSDRDRGVIIPIKAVDEVVKTFTEDEEVKVAIQDNQVIVANDSAVLNARLVDGEYPSYSQILPKDNPIRFEVDREAFLTAIRRVSLFSDPKTTAVRLDIKETSVVLSAQTPDFGEAREEIQATSTEPITIGFNAEFLKDALTAADSENVAFELKEPLSAAVMRPSGTDDYLCLIMPMRIEA